MRSQSLFMKDFFHVLINLLMKRRYLSKIQVDKIKKRTFTYKILQKSKLKNKSLILISFYIKSMTKIAVSELSPSTLNELKNSITLLGKEHQYLIDLLFSPPNDFMRLLYALPDVPTKTKKIWKDQLSILEIRIKIYCQLNAITDWNYDEEPLIHIFQEICTYFMLNPIKLLREFFSARLKNGLIYYDLLEDKLQIIRLDESNLKFFKMVLTKQYDSFAEQFNERRIYCRRNNFLNGQQKLQFQIRTVLMIEKLRKYDQTIKPQSLINVDKYFQNIMRPQYSRILYYTVQLNHPISLDILNQLQNIFLTDEGQVPFLQFGDFPYSKLINSQILSYVLQSDKLSFFSKQSYFKKENGMFLKYNPLKIYQKQHSQIMSMLIQQPAFYFVNMEEIQEYSEMLKSQQNVEKRQQFYLKLSSKIEEYLLFFYTVIDCIKDGKIISYYESFDKFAQYQEADIDSLIVMSIHQIYSSSRFITKMKNVAFIPLLGPFYHKKFFSSFSHILQRTQTSKKLSSLLQNNIHFKLLLLLLQHSQIDSFLNSKQFLASLSQHLQEKVITMNQNILGSFKEFLDTNWKALINFGFKPSDRLANKIFQLKLNELLNSLFEQGQGQFQQRRRFQNLLSNVTLNPNKQKLADIVSKYPGFIEYFKSQLIVRLKKSDDMLKQVNIFDIDQTIKDKICAIFIYLLDENIIFDEDLKSFTKDLIKKYPQILTKMLIEYDWKKLADKMSIDLTQQTVSQTQVLASLASQINLLDYLPVSAFCEKQSPNSPEINHLINSIAYLQILIRQRKGEFISNKIMKKWFEITIDFQRIESQISQQIYKYQKNYTDEQLDAMIQYYSSIKVYKKTLFFSKINDYFSDLNQICWIEIGKYKRQAINQSILEYQFCFQRLKETKNLQFKERILTKSSSNFRILGNISNTCIIPQFYNYNRSLLFSVLSEYESYGSVEEDYESINESNLVLKKKGYGLLKLIKEKRKKNENFLEYVHKIQELNLKSSYIKLIQAFFEWNDQPSIILNKNVFAGKENKQILWNSVVLNAIELISDNLNANNLDFSSRIIQAVFSFPNSFSEQGSNSKQQLYTNTELAIDIVQDTTMRKKILLKLASGLIQMQSQIQGNKNAAKFYFSVLSQLKNGKQKEQAMIETHFRDLIEIFTNKLSKNNIKPSQFADKSLWIGSFLQKVNLRNFSDKKISQFITQYLGYLLRVIEKSSLQQAHSASLCVIQKCLPMQFPDSSNEDFTKFAHLILNIVIKIANSNPLEEYSPFLKKILIKLSKNSRKDFNRYFIQVARILTTSKVQWEQIFVLLLVGQNKQVTEMEADIKAYFLRESQNLVDQSQTKISTLLSVFTDQFQLKYSEKIGQFTSIVGKFVKRTTADVVKRGKIRKICYLVWDRKEPFAYSQSMKNNFMDYQPQNVVLEFIHLHLTAKDNKIATQTLSFLKRSINYHPLIIPHIIFHPVSHNQTKLPLFQYLIERLYTDEKQNNFILNFMFSFCLDHSCIIKLKEKAIFISEYLCYRIIKKIIEKDINQSMILLILHLIQLKKFAFVSKLKINKQVGSLQSVLLQKLKKDRGSQYFQYGHNIAIYKILEIIYKQDEIDNLKQSYEIKKSKQERKNYKLVEDCLIPFKAYKPPRNRKKQKKQKYFGFTGNINITYFSQIYEDLQLDQLYSQLNIKFEISKIYRQKLDHLPEFSQQKSKICILDPKFQLFGEIQKEYQPYSFEKTAIKTIFTQANKQFFIFQQGVRFIYTQTDKKGVDYIRFRDNIEWAIRDRRNEEELGTMFDPEIARMLQRQNRRGRGRGGRGRRGRDRINNRYVAEDYSTIEQIQGNQKEKNAQQQFKQKIKNATQNLCTDNQIEEFGSSITLELYNQAENNQQIEELINKINNNIEALSENPNFISKKDLFGKSFLKQRQELQFKLLETQFDLNHLSMEPQQFKHYCQGNANKLQKLDEARVNRVLQAQDQLFSINLKRTQSSESYIYIQDTIDYNFANIRRSLSKKSSISSENSDLSADFEDDMSKKGYSFEFSNIPLEAFPQVTDQIIYELILSLYYNCRDLSHNVIGPLLQNKRIQGKVLNTLIYIMRNPFENELFPHNLYSLSIFQQKKWLKNDENGIIVSQQQQSDLIIRQILRIILAVKSYCLYKNDQFLFETIHYQGILGITLQPRPQFAGSFSQQGHQPFAQILDFAMENNRKLVSLIIKQATFLPPILLDRLFKIFKINDNFYKETASFKRKLFSIQEYLENLSHNEAFINKFRKIYPFQVNDPNFYIISHLLESNIYSKQQLKSFHQKALMTFKVSQIDKLEFFNKVISIYSDDQIRNQCSFLASFKEIHAKVIKELLKKRQKIEKQPIYKLFKYPEYLDFQMKVQLFYNQLANQYEQYGTYSYDCVTSRKSIGIFQSAFQDLKNKPDEFWVQHISVAFLDKNNNPERGGGLGVDKEWFNLLSSEMVNLDYGLFIKSENNHFHFNPQAGHLNVRCLQYLEFIGKIFALACINPSFFINPEFSFAFYKKMLGQKVEIEDLFEEFDEGQALKNLQLIKKCKSEEQFNYLCLGNKFEFRDVRLLSGSSYNTLKSNQEQMLGTTQTQHNRIELISQYFPITIPGDKQAQEKVIDGKAYKIAEVIELFPGGSDIEVTFQNRNSFVELTQSIVFTKLFTNIEKQFNAFMEGFNRIIDQKLITLFKPEQLKQLIQGSNIYTGNLVEDIKKNVKINGYNLTDQVILWLWEELQLLSPQDKINFMNHWTSLRKLPNNGLAELNLSISKRGNKILYGGNCVNNLGLYPYETKEQLRENIQLAVCQIKYKQSFLVG